MAELLLSIYFDVEITCGKKVYDSAEVAEMYPISYSFIVAFNLGLNLEKIFVVRSFNHTFKQLNDASYLLNKILKISDPVTAKQLRDCAKAVF